MSSSADITILDITDAAEFGRLPPCADPRFDHRSCDYWEDDVRGSKSARPSWWEAARPAPRPKPSPRSDNPFAPPARDDPGFNPFDAGSGGSGEADFNPFAPQPEVASPTSGRDTPAKLRLLSRGRRVFGSYAKVMVRDGEPVAFAQFGPLSAYPRAQHVRELYPRLPQSPLPAVITCVATTPEARHEGYGKRLVEAVAEDLASRGFSAIEAYPDLTLASDEASAATPAFWELCGFERVADDERYPVMRRELA